MKLLLITITLLLVIGIPVSAQTVEISQAAADKCVENTQKLDAAQKVIDQFLKERTASDLALAKANQVIEIDKLLLDAKDALIAIKDRKEAAYIELISVYDKIVAAQSQMIDKLMAKMLKPKSSLQKFLDGVRAIIRDIGFIAAGAAISRL